MVELYKIVRFTKISTFTSNCVNISLYYKESYNSNNIFRNFYM